MPSKRPDISELNKRITFLKQSQGKDSYGAPTMVYKEATSCWASVESQQLVILLFNSLISGRLEGIKHQPRMIHHSNFYKHLGAQKTHMRVHF